VPSRLDYYLMMVAAEVRRGYVKNPERVKLADFLLRFEPYKKNQDVDWKERGERSKSLWKRLVGLK